MPVTLRAIGSRRFPAVGGTGKAYFRKTIADAALGRMEVLYPEYLAMIEQRLFERMPIGRLALLSFDGISGVHPAMVREISTSGASVWSSYHIFANRFALSFDGFRSTFACRVVWREERLCGISFVSRGALPDSAKLSAGARRITD